MVLTIEGHLRVYQPEVSIPAKLPQFDHNFSAILIKMDKLPISHRASNGQLSIQEMRVRPVAFFMLSTLQVTPSIPTQQTSSTEELTQILIGQRSQIINQDYVMFMITGRLLREPVLMSLVLILPPFNSQ